MPIDAVYREDEGMLVTVLSGMVTDQELIDYYAALLAGLRPAGRCELVDGRGVGALAITAEGLAAFGRLLWENVDRIPRSRRCAMLAGNDVVHGLFRVWQVEKGALPYALEVFLNDEERAMRWLRGETEAG